MSSFMSIFGLFNIPVKIPTINDYAQKGYMIPSYYDGINEVMTL